MTNDVLIKRAMRVAKGKKAKKRSKYAIGGNPGDLATGGFGTGISGQAATPRDVASAVSRGESMAASRGEGGNRQNVNVNPASSTQSVGQGGDQSAAQQQAISQAAQDAVNTPLNRSTYNAALSNPQATSVRLGDNPMAAMSQAGVDPAMAELTQQRLANSAATQSALDAASRAVAQGSSLNQPSSPPGFMGGPEKVASEYGLGTQVGTIGSVWKGMNAYGIEDQATKTQRMQDLLGQAMALKSIGSELRYEFAPKLQSKATIDPTTADVVTHWTGADTLDIPTELGSRPGGLGYSTIIDQAGNVTYTQPFDTKGMLPANRHAAGREEPGAASLNRSTIGISSVGTAPNAQQLAASRALASEWFNPNAQVSTHGYLAGSGEYEGVPGLFEQRVTQGVLKPEYGKQRLEGEELAAAMRSGFAGPSQITSPTAPAPSQNVSAAPTPAPAQQVSTPVAPANKASQEVDSAATAKALELARANTAPAAPVRTGTPDYYEGYQTSATGNPVIDKQISDALIARDRAAGVQSYGYNTDIPGQQSIRSQVTQPNELGAAIAKVQARIDEFNALKTDQEKDQWVKDHPQEIAEMAAITKAMQQKYGGDAYKFSDPPANMEIIGGKRVDVPVPGTWYRDVAVTIPKGTPTSETVTSIAPNARAIPAGYAGISDVNVATPLSPSVREGAAPTMQSDRYAANQSYLEGLTAPGSSFNQPARSPLNIGRTPTGVPEEIIPTGINQIPRTPNLEVVPAIENPKVPATLLERMMNPELFDQAALAEREAILADQAALNQTDPNKVAPTLREYIRNPGLFEDALAAERAAMDADAQQRALDMGADATPTLRDFVADPAGVNALGDLRRAQAVKQAELDRIAAANAAASNRFYSAPSRPAFSSDPGSLYRGTGFPTGSRVQAAPAPAPNVIDATSGEFTSPNASQSQLDAVERALQSINAASAPSVDPVQSALAMSRVQQSVPSSFSPIYGGSSQLTGAGPDLTTPVTGARPQYTGPLPGYKPQVPVRSQVAPVRSNIRNFAPASREMLRRMGSDNDRPLSRRPLPEEIIPPEAEIPVKPEPPLAEDIPVSLPEIIGETPPSDLVDVASADIINEPDPVQSFIDSLPETIDPVIYDPLYTGVEYDPTAQGELANMPIYYANRGGRIARAGGGATTTINGITFPVKLPDVPEFVAPPVPNYTIPEASPLVAQFVNSIQPQQGLPGQTVGAPGGLFAPVAPTTGVATQPTPAPAPVDLGSIPSSGAAQPAPGLGSVDLNAPVAPTPAPITTTPVTTTPAPTPPVTTTPVAPAPTPPANTWGSGWNANGGWSSGLTDAERQTVREYLDQWKQDNPRDRSSRAARQAWEAARNQARLDYIRSMIGSSSTAQAPVAQTPVAPAPATTTPTGATSSSPVMDAYINSLTAPYTGGTYIQPSGVQYEPSIYEQANTGALTFGADPTNVSRAAPDIPPPQPIVYSPTPAPALVKPVLADYFKQYQNQGWGAFLNGYRDYRKALDEYNAAINAKAHGGAVRNDSINNALRIARGV